MRRLRWGNWLTGCMALGFLATNATAAVAQAMPADPLAPHASAPVAVPVAATVTARTIRQPDAFGTRALDGGVTLYDARFRRVAAADRAHPWVRRLAEPLVGLSPEALLARVKRETEQRVAYAADREHLGVADLWLNAGETLDAGRGDEEDLAIAQMQVLKAAGFPAADLYLTLGRDAHAAPHFVLLARTAQGYFRLDRHEATVVPADPGHGFQPMLSIGPGRSWAHGYAVRRPAASSTQIAAR